MRVHFFNLSMTDNLGDVSLDDAIAYGVAKCFEFVVYNMDGDKLASWSPIGGLRS